MKAYLRVTLLLILLGLATADLVTVTSEFTNAELNSEDLNGWNINGDGDGYTKCSKVSIIGGSGAFGKGSYISKTYEGVPNHYELKISFTLYLIDSWDNEFFKVLINGAEVYSI